MENFKTECILNMDQSILDESHKSAVEELDLHVFNTDDVDKTSSLLDLEKPIMNIIIDNRLE